MPTTDLFEDAAMVLRDVVALVGIHRGASEGHPVWGPAWRVLDRAGLDPAEPLTPARNVIE